MVLLEYFWCVWSQHMIWSMLIGLVFQILMPRPNGKPQLLITMRKGEGSNWDGWVFLKQPHQKPSYPKVDSVGIKVLYVFDDFYMFAAIWRFNTIQPVDRGWIVSKNQDLYHIRELLPPTGHSGQSLQDHCSRGWLFLRRYHWGPNKMGQQNYKLMEEILHRLGM